MKKISIFLLTACMIFACVGCKEKPADQKTGSESVESAKTGGKLESIQSSGQLVVYTNANFPPFEFTAGNEIKGVDAEIGKAIAEELGVTATFKDAAFEGLCASLSTGKGDIVISGMTITEKRKEEVDFSNPYIKSVQYLILPKNSAIGTFEDLAGKKVGVALGYTGEFCLDDEMNGIEEDDGTKIPGILEGKGTTKKTYKNAMDAALDMLAGKADAIIMDQFVAQKIVANDEKLKAIPLVYANGDDVSEEYGVAIAKGNENLVEKINQVIDRLTAENKVKDWVISFSE